MAEDAAAALRFSVLPSAGGPTPCPTLETFERQYHSLGRKAIASIQWDMRGAAFAGTGVVKFGNARLASQALGDSSWTLEGAAVSMKAARGANATATRTRDSRRSRLILHTGGFSDALDCPALAHHYAATGATVAAVHLPLKRNAFTGDIEVEVPAPSDLDRVAAAPAPDLNRPQPTAPTPPTPPTPPIQARAKARLLRVPKDATIAEVLAAFADLGEGAVTQVLPGDTAGDRCLWFRDLATKLRAFGTPHRTLRGRPVTLWA